jgi:hypothetical protein
MRYGIYRPYGEPRDEFVARDDTDSPTNGGLPARTVTPPSVSVHRQRCFPSTDPSATNGRVSPRASR